MLMDIKEIGALVNISAGESKNLDKWLLISFSQFLFWCSFSIAAAQIFLGLSVLIFIAIYLKQKSLKSPLEYRSLFYLIILFVLWEALASIIGEQPIRSLIDLRGEWLFLAIPITIYLCRTKGIKERLLISLTIGVLILSVYALIQSITGIDFPTGYLKNENGYRLVGFFSHPLTFGNYIATASIFLSAFTILKFKTLTNWKRILFITASTLATAATFLSNSRGPLLALIIGLILLGILIRKFRYPLIILIVISVSLPLFIPNLLDSQIERVKIDLNSENPDSRLMIWLTSLKIIKANPILGVGQSNFGKEYRHTLPEDINKLFSKGHAHNDLLHIAATSGLPAMLLYLSIWLFILMRFRRGYLSSERNSFTRALNLGALLGSIVFFAASMTETVFADEEVRHLLMFIWGIGLVSSEENKERVTEN